MDVGEIPTRTACTLSTQGSTSSDDEDSKTDGRLTLPVSKYLCSSGTYQSVSRTKYSRKNTLEEKRRMRRERVKRNRKEKLKAKVSKLKGKLDTESQLRRRAEQGTISYKNMARTFWERWRWEVHKRREVMIDNLRTRPIARFDSGGISSSSSIQEINRTMLRNPVMDGEEREHFVGRGCFGVVKVQLFRGIQVVVKEFLPRSLIADVMHEASILTSLCHPYLPHLLGVCTKDQPLCVVMQFHAFEGLQASTMENELHRHRFDGRAWTLLCAQLLEAIAYLHEEANVLHNDIKVNNVLVAQSFSSEDSYQVVLIDFGKATRMSESKRYHLSDLEKREYARRHPHISPEVIEGEMKQHLQ